MTPSEKEKIIKEGFDAIRSLYNLRDDLLSDSEKLEAVKESNRKLSDRVANLEVTIRTLNSAIDKKDVEIKRLDTRLKSTLTTIEALERNRDSIYDKYLELCHICDADEEIKKNMIAEKYKSEIAELESNFHELRQKLTDMYMTGTLRGFSTSDFTEFAKWFEDTFGNFGIYDEEE